MGASFPRQVLHPTSICAVNPAPVDTTQRKKPTHSSINLKGMATQNESTCRLHHYLHLLHLHYSYICSKPSPSPPPQKERSKVIGFWRDGGLSVYPPFYLSVEVRCLKHTPPHTSLPLSNMNRDILFLGGVMDSSQNILDSGRCGALANNHSHVGFEKWNWTQMNWYSTGDKWLEYGLRVNALGLWSIVTAQIVVRKYNYDDWLEEKRNAGVL